MTSAHSKAKRQRDTKRITRANRKAEHRVQDALTDARKSDAKLGKRMAYEQEATAGLLEAARAAKALADQQVLDEAARAAAAAEVARLEEIREKQERWPLGAARNLVRDGYTPWAVAKRTGWPEDMLSDVRRGVWA